MTSLRLCASPARHEFAVQRLLIATALPPSSELRELRRSTRYLPGLLFHRSEALRGAEKIPC